LNKVDEDDNGMEMDVEEEEADIDTGDDPRHFVWRDI